MRDRFGGMSRFAALAVLVSATGCEIDIDSRVTQAQCSVGSAQVCLDAVGKSDFTWIHDNILIKNCTGSSCHESDSTSNAKKTPYLMIDEAYSSLLKESNIYPGQQIVVPNNPQQSILLLMTPEVAPPDFDPPQSGKPSVGFMPQANGALCCQKLDTLKAWINAGAPSI
jgi:hypothetical protein